MKSGVQVSPDSVALKRMRSKATGLLTDVRQFGQHIVTHGIGSAIATAALTKRRRNSGDQVVPPDSPLGWESTLEGIRRHYALDALTEITWSEAETRRDIRRIVALSTATPSSSGQDPGGQPSQYSVLVTEVGQLRHVLATIEALRSWPNGRTVPVRVVLTSRDREPWDQLARLPSVCLTATDGDEEALESAVIPIKAGDLPMPHWLTNQISARPSRSSGGATKLLILSEHVPDVRRGSGSQDVYWFARHAVELGHRVLFVPLSPRNNDAGARWDLRKVGVQVVSGRLSRSELLQSLAFTVSESDFVAVFNRSHAPIVRQIIGTEHRRPKLLFVPLDLKQFPQATLIERGLQPSLVRFGFRVPSLADVRALKEEEFAAIRASDLTAVISADELEHLSSSDVADRLVHLPMLRSNLEFVGSSDSCARIVFVGGFGHPPNYIAVQWFLDEIWPHINRRFNGISFEIFGADLDPEWRDKWSQFPGVVVRGPYEHEWEPYVGDVIAVAPLPYGGGTKGKVVAALGHGAVVVGTPFATQGLPAEVQRSVVVAEEAPDFVDTLSEIITDDQARARKRTEGRIAYERFFTESAGRLEVQRCLETLAAMSETYGSK